MAFLDEIMTQQQATVMNQVRQHGFSLIEIIKMTLGYNSRTGIGQMANSPQPMALSLSQ